MNERLKDLSDLKSYIQNTDEEITMILRNFFWDQKHIVEKPPLIGCRYNPHHKISMQTKTQHEDKCYLTRYGYTLDEPLLPDPVDDITDTLVKHSKEDIQNIIHAAARFDSAFQTGCHGPEPLSVDRLQQTYTADERRAIYNAVVSAAPFCHDLADLALGSGTDTGKKTKTRLEVLAELRDMRRRRVKYRVASKTSNYSNVLRDVIKTQMDLYAESHGVFIKTEYGAKTFVSLNDKDSISRMNKTSDNFFLNQKKVPPKDLNDTGSERDKQHDRERQERDSDRYSRENRYDSYRRHAKNRSRSRDRDRNTRRYRDERDKRSTDYNIIKKEIKSDRPQAYRKENTDGEMSEIRHRYEDRHRHKNRYRYDDRNIRDSSTKNVNDTQLLNANKHKGNTKPVEIKQEIMDEYEVKSENKDNYEDINMDINEQSIKSEVDSQEYENQYKDREQDRHEDEDRHRNDDRYDKRHKHRYEDRQRRNDGDVDRHRRRDGKGYRDDNGDKNKKRHRCEEKDDRRHSQRDENDRRHNRDRCEDRDDHGDADSHRGKHENEDRYRNKGRHNRKEKSEGRHRHESKNSHEVNYTYDRKDNREDKHRSEDRYRRERHNDLYDRTELPGSSFIIATAGARDKSKDFCYSRNNDDYSQHDEYDISRVKQEKEDT